MNLQQIELHHRLQTYSLDDSAASLPFTRRLARDNCWSYAYAQRAVEEYKKFAFLAIAAGHPVTPSDQVDQVWHQHLLYTQAYWDDFCPNVLQQPLHHNPTQGGSQEQQKFDAWYDKTLGSYEAFFGPPPDDIWPPAHIRFGRDLHFKRMNTQSHWVIPKAGLFQHQAAIAQIAVLILLALSLIGGGAAIAQDYSFVAPADWLTGSFADWVPVYVGGVLVVELGAVIALILRNASCITVCLFFLFGLGMVRMLVGISALPGLDFLGFYGLTSLIAIVMDLTVHFPPLKRGVKHKPRKRTVVHTISSNSVLFAIPTLYVLGIVRIVIGLFRGRPVGFLALMGCVLCAYLWFVWMKRQAYNLKREKFNPEIDLNPCGLEPYLSKASRLKIYAKRHSRYQVRRNALNTGYGILILTGSLLAVLGFLAFGWLLVCLATFIIIDISIGANSGDGGGGSGGGGCGGGGCGGGGCGGGGCGG